VKITLLVTGKTTGDYLKDGISLYSGRIKHYISFEIKVIPDLKNTKNLSAAQVRETEGKLAMEQINKADTLIILDERGELLNSEEFARFIEKKMISGCRNLIFLAGGSFGFSELVYGKASGIISLSKMTFSHQLIRLIFMEQLYRAFTIIKGEPYHH
jgi:23S rRNA (pseudouridine1915-N3)-methyltransferase